MIDYSDFCTPPLWALFLYLFEPSVKSRCARATFFQPSSTPTYPAKTSFPTHPLTHFLTISHIYHIPLSIMSHTTPSEADIVRTLSDLKLSTKTPQKPKSKPKSAPVADSWDDDDLSGSDTETETETTSSLSRPTSKDAASSKLSPINTASSEEPPNPPPPTPASPTPFDFPDNTPYAAAKGRGLSIDAGRTARGADSSPARRPEKTTAVAGRLIAGALGVRAPKRTEEEREYDKAMREKERKRRDEERNREKLEKERAAERARAVWED